jgi:DNA primase
LPKEFISLANKNLPITSRYPINYLSSRGITKQDILKWKIGYCATGKYEGRVIFPSFDLSGRLNYFVARSYTGDWKRYSNPPNKSNIIFNHLSLDFAYPIVVVEGVFDAVKSGVNSVPLLGSTLKEESILLNEIVKNDTTVYLALDSDATKKTEKLIDLFLKYDIETFLVDISATKHQDVGEMTKQEFEFCKFNSEKVTISSYTTNRIMNI